MTCDTASLLIHFARHDLAAEDQAALQSHLAGCPTCAALAKRHQADDAALAAAMTAIPVPVGLRDALQTQAIAARNAIWRQTWLGRLSALAAVVVLAVLGAGLAANLSRPALDSEALFAGFEPGVSSSDTFDDWAKAEGVPPLPVGFNLGLLSFTGQLPLAGRDTPAIRLQSGTESAIVYFVRNSRFDVSRLGEGASGSQGVVRIFRDTGWTIIIIHTGPSLAPFLHQPGSSA